MDAPHCPKCQAQMEPAQTVCPSCGLTVVPEYTPDPVEGDPGAFYCYRHKREVTRLRCGRCGRAICTKCAMIGPAGPRCPDCGKSKVPVRGRAVVHEFTASLRGIFYGPFRIIIIIVLVSMVIGLAQSCFNVFASRSAPPVEQYEEE